MELFSNIWSIVLDAIAFSRNLCLCLLFNSSAGTSSRRALKAEMRARTNDEIM